MPGLGHWLTKEATRVALGAFMAEVGNPIIGVVRDILGPLTKTRWGTKALLAMLSVAAIAGLAYLGKPLGPWGVGGIVVINVAYAIFRREQDKQKGDST